MAKDLHSYISEGAEFHGKFYSQGVFKINGRFEGELKVDDLIQIGPTGRVKTNIQAKRVIIEGSLLGNINATEEVVITETGRIMGDITTPHLQLGKGVVVNGKINITGGQPKPSRQIFQEIFEEKKASTIDRGTRKPGKEKTDAKTKGKKKNNQ